MASYNNCRPAGFSDSGSGSDTDDFNYIAPATTNKSGTSNQSAGGTQINSSSASCSQPQHRPEEQCALPPNSRPQQQQQYPVASGLSRGRGRGRGLWGGRGYTPRAAQTAQFQDHGNCFNPSQYLQEEGDRKQSLLSKITSFQNGASAATWTYSIGVSNKLKSLWENTNSNESFRVAANELFGKCMSEGKNIWDVGLFCTVNSTDFTFQQMGYQSTAIISGLKHFMDSQKIAAKPSQEIQEAAVEAAVGQRKINELKVLAEVFDLANSSHKMRFIPVIKEKISSKNFREACQCATFLKLQDEFDIHAFLVPLLLQDRCNLVEDCIQHRPELQQKLVKFIDGFFGEEFPSLQQGILDYITTNGIMEDTVKMNKIGHKPMSKLVKTLAARFKISSSHYSNVGHRQKFGELRFLFARRYEKKEMSAESFEELVNQIADESEKMKEEVLDHYLLYGDVESAAKFIIANNLYTSPVCLNLLILPLLPEPHRTNLENSSKEVPKVEESWDDDVVIGNGTTPSTSTQAPATSSAFSPPAPVSQEENWDEVENGEIPEVEGKSILPKTFYRCQLSADCVKIIDSPESVMQLCSWLKAQRPTPDAEFVVSGFDSEWKPIMSRRHGAALLQLALLRKIFIIDVVTLKQNQEPDTTFWKALRESYFENENILKLGFDVKNDIKMLTETITEWKELSQCWKSVVDLSAIKTILLKEDPRFFRSTSINGESGLSELVSQCLGKSLSKSEQMSDWEKRPLRESQIHYAADDAYCLIDVFNAMVEMSKSSHVDFMKIIHSYLRGSSQLGSACSKRRLGYVGTVLELTKIFQEERATSKLWSSGLTPKDSSSIKLVVDNMLQGLGRYLRVLGFDTVILNNSQTHDMCCQYAVAGRKVITKGVAYNEITSRTAEDVVYNMKSDKILDQLQEICRFYKIALQPSRFFVLCQDCNSTEFIKISSWKMKDLFSASGILKRVKMDGFNPKSFRGPAPDDMILCVGDVLKDWRLLEEDDFKILDDGRVTTERGTLVRLNKLQTFAQVIDWLYICTECGKCYWESSQLEKQIMKSLHSATNEMADGK